MTNFQFMPGPFKAKDADPELTFERFDYVETMEHVFLNNRAGSIPGNKIKFNDVEKKYNLEIEGGSNMRALFKHMGKMADDDTYT